jgi:lysozyme family protein
MTFDEAFDKLMGHEGGYSNHSADPGGETMWGITARVARRHGYMGNMRDLPRETAKAIAKPEYWNPVHADELPEGVRFDVFDTSYNSGQKQAAQLLQRAAGVSDDGVIGPKTMAAAHALPPAKLSMRFNAERLEFLCNLPTFGAFGKGWTRRVAGNLKISAEQI